MAEQEVALATTPEIPTPEVIQEKKTEVDLITRVSQVKAPEPQKKVEETGDKFNSNDLDSQIEKIQDPALKEQMGGLKKSLLKGENQKYQEIATLRKQYEQRLAEVSTWTPERLKQEINKPDFVQAAQQVLQVNPQTGVAEEQYSALSETEKTELTQLKQKINLLERSNWESAKLQQDAQVASKYANYDPKIIDDLTVNLMQNKVQATREDLWKVIDYENAVKRAYELGKQDKVIENQEKISGMSFGFGMNIPNPQSIERNKGESVESFLRRSYAQHTKSK